MMCHYTGQTPSREYPRKNFVAVVTPLGPLWFRDKPTAEEWLEVLPKEAVAFLRGEHMDTPGAIALRSTGNDDD